MTTDTSSQSQLSEGAGQLFVVSAPSGAGKTSLVKALIESSEDVGVAISHTTRTKRPEEKDAVNYYFTDEETFMDRVGNGEFLEWANVFGHLYGTSVAAANDVLVTGKHIVLEIDWQGAAQVRERVPNAQTIFIFPPSLDALRDRLESRAQDDEATVDKRMDAAFEELSHYDEFDFHIINDEFDRALSDLRQVVSGTGGHVHRDHQLSDLQPLIRDLLPQLMP